MNRYALYAITCILPTLLTAAPIGIIDSGVDYRHAELKPNIWINPKSETIDADGKVYREDTHGWNFAESNNQVIDYKYLGTFSPDCRRIFEVQSKILHGLATEEEKAWYQAKKEDLQFLKELQKFGNFVHGTHVSGISAGKAESSAIIAMKLIPTETPGQASLCVTPTDSRGADNPMVKLMLTMMAQRQADLLTTIGKYTAATQARVANGSFGTSVKAVAPLIRDLLKQMLGQEPSEADTQAYARFFVEKAVELSASFVKAAPNTLFVFAAGNDGTDNDGMPVSPANIKAANTLTVAATLDRASLASFSNYGARMVEVAAPGVAIVSTIPGDEKLPMSGTSMAAPFVTNVAGLIADENPSLTIAEIKNIILRTVDIKSFLKGKVATGGIVNGKRAMRAAVLTREIPFDSAIQKAVFEVSDEPSAVLPPLAVDWLPVPIPILW